ncbi:PM34-like protein [Mya arenaria]|uniref:PM34-like protein n=1 Tax=Mya arenaria TaxID=6604 RepID=A0ABY7DGB8_MYAAR|nr:PM34-like protein [Mya arenaria]
MSKKKLAELKFLPVVYTVEDDMKNGGMSNVFSYNNLVHAVAGAVGSVVSMTVFYPLDTARTRLQARGIPILIQRSSSRGYDPMLLKLCLLLHIQQLEDGVVNVLVTTPLWVVNTRLKLQGAHMETEEMHENTGSRYKGILDCLIKIVREEGLSALWNGTKPSLVLATNPAIHFMVYEAASYKKEKKSHSIIGALSDIMRVSGLTGLYKGMEAKLLQTVLTAALMFMVYEKLASATFRVMGLEYVRPATVR